MHCSDFFQAFLCLVQDSTVPPPLFSSLPPPSPFVLLITLHNLAFYYYQESSQLASTPNCIWCGCMRIKNQNLFVAQIECHVYLYVQYSWSVFYCIAGCSGISIFLQNNFWLRSTHWTSPCHKIRTIINLRHAYDEKAFTTTEQEYSLC